MSSNDSSKSGADVPVMMVMNTQGERRIELGITAGGGRSPYTVQGFVAKEVQIVQTVALGPEPPPMQQTAPLENQPVRDPSTTRPE